MTVAEKFAAFFASLGIVVLIGVAGIMAFFAACLVGVGVLPGAPGGGQNEMSVVILFTAIGGIGAIAVMGWLFFITWPRKK